MVKMTTATFTNDSDLVASLQTVAKGATFATMVATTVPKMTVKHRDTKAPYSECFKGEVFCTSTKHVLIGASYENCVNNQLKREGMSQLTFTAESLPYGEWVAGLENVCIKHNDAFQLRYMENMNANAPKSEYVYHYGDGTELTESERALLKGFLPVKSEAKNQGTEKEVTPRNIKVAGIVSLKAYGVEWTRK